MSVLIKGGRIVTAADDYVGDVFVDNGTVAMLGRSLDVTADKTIDATGKLVIPGAIDPHTHIEMYFGGTVTCDDFTSGTVSAAFGGTTTLVDFCMQAPGTSFAQALETYQEKIDRCKPVIDVGFHIGVTDLHDGGTILGPQWERYGDAPYGELEEGNVFTIEPTILMSPQPSMLVEENVLVTADGAEWLSERQTHLWLAGR